jgi:hypothetical protein
MTLRRCLCAFLKQKESKTTKTKKQEQKRGETCFEKKKSTKTFISSEEIEELSYSYSLLLSFPRRRYY